jgi:hypothetical protein
MLTGPFGTMDLDTPVIAQFPKHDLDEYTPLLYRTSKFERCPWQAQTVAPASVIQDSKVMDILLDCLKDGGSEIIDLMNDLPTAAQVIDRLRAVSRKVHHNFSDWLSADRPGFFQYVLSTISQVPGLATELIAADFMDCVLDNLLTATNTSVIHQLLAFLDSHLTEPLFDRYATKAFCALAGLVCANLREETRWLFEYALCVMASFSRFVKLQPFEVADQVPIFESASFENSPMEAKVLVPKDDIVRDLLQLEGPDPAAREYVIGELLRWGAAKWESRSPGKAPPGAVTSLPSVAQSVGDAKLTDGLILFNFCLLTLTTDSEIIGTAAAAILASVSCPLDNFVSLFPFVDSASAPRFAVAAAPHFTELSPEIRDVLLAALNVESPLALVALASFHHVAKGGHLDDDSLARIHAFIDDTFLTFDKPLPIKNEIGRASCRERV